MNVDLHDYLFARQYGYLLLQRLLGTKPNTNLASALDAQATREMLDIVLGCGWENINPTVAELVSSFEAIDGDDPSLTSDYTRLFEGPSALPAPLWESVYKTGKRMIMDKSTLSVRDAYMRSGFIPQEYRRVPDDHIALELDFLRALAARAFEAEERGDTENSMEALRASFNFIDEHLGTWASHFATNLAERGESWFYSRVGELLAVFIEADRAKLKSLV